MTYQGRWPAITRDQASRYSYGGLVGKPLRQDRATTVPILERTHTGSRACNGSERGGVIRSLSETVAKIWAACREATGARRETGEEG